MRTYCGRREKPSLEVMGGVLTMAADSEGPNEALYFFVFEAIRTRTVGRLLRREYCCEDLGGTREMDARIWMQEEC